MEEDNGVTEDNTRVTIKQNRIRNLVIPVGGNVNDTTTLSMHQSSVENLSIQAQGNVILHYAQSGHLEADTVSAEDECRLRLDSSRKTKLAPFDHKECLEAPLNERIKKEVAQMSESSDEIKHPRMIKCKLHEAKPRRNTEAFENEDQVYPVAEDENIEFENIFEESDRFVALIGGPGSGRSTVVKRYGRAVLEGKIAVMKSISVVYFIEASELCGDNTPLRFFKFLFANIVHGLEVVSSNALEWLKDEQNQTRLLLLIDGLENLQGWGMDKSCGRFDYDSVRPRSEILHNILSGRLLPNAKILAATRGYGIQNYHKNIAPQKTIKLTELSGEDTKFLFNKMVKAENKELAWEKLSEGLKSLCSIPLFLKYITEMFEDMVGKEIDNVSSIILNVLRNFASKEEWTSNKEFFPALKKFAFYSLKKGKFTFTDDDLQDFNLDGTKLRLLCVFTPKKLPGVMEECPKSTYTSFSHYLLQKSIACLGFLDLENEEDFNQLLKDRIHQPTFYTLRQLACGILINRSTVKVFEGIIDVIPDKEKKAKQLAQCMEDQLSCNMSASEMLRYLECLSEMGDDMKMFIKRYPDLINICMIPLSLYDTRTISRVLVACSKLSELSLYGCSLDDSKVEMIWKYLKNSQLTINFLDLGRNRNLQVRGLKLVAKIVLHCQVKELDLRSCDIDKAQMESFWRGVAGSQKCSLDGLCLCGNKNLGEGGMEMIAKVVQHVKLQKLDITDCNITEGHLRVIMKYDIESLQTLMLTRNKLEESGLHAVGEFVIKAMINELHINWCNIQCCDLKALETSLQSANQEIQLTELNVSNNKELVNSSECLKLLCEMAQNYHIKRMDIHNCNFSDEWKNELKSRSVELMRLDSYETLEMETEKFTNFLEANGRRLIDVSLRNTPENVLKKLPELLKANNTQLRKLCLSEGRRSNENDAKCIVELLPCISEELWLGEWTVDEECREFLQAGLDDLKQNLTINFSTEDIMTKTIEDPIS